MRECSPYPVYLRCRGKKARLHPPQLRTWIIRGRDPQCANEYRTVDHEQPAVPNTLLRRILDLRCVRPVAHWDGPFKLSRNSRMLRGETDNAQGDVRGAWETARCWCARNTAHLSNELLELPRRGNVWVVRRLANQVSTRLDSTTCAYRRFRLRPTEHSGFVLPFTLLNGITHIQPSSKMWCSVPAMPESQANTGMLRAQGTN